MNAIVSIAIRVVFSVVLLNIGGCMTPPQRDVQEVGAVVPDHWGETQSS